VLADAAASRLTAAEKRLFAFIDRVNHASVDIGPADIDALHDAGWTDEAIYDALTVCALFNFYNRWIDATGVHAMTDEAHRAGAKRMVPGYLRTDKG
jgi:alkylhydroperoxidase family enzyme